MHHLVANLCIRLNFRFLLPLVTTTALWNEKDFYYATQISSNVTSWFISEPDEESKLLERETATYNVTDISTTAYFYYNDRPKDVTYTTLTYNITKYRSREPAYLLLGCKMAQFEF